MSELEEEEEAESCAPFQLMSGRLKLTKALLSSSSSPFDSNAAAVGGWVSLATRIAYVHISRLKRTENTIITYIRCSTEILT